MYHLAMPPFMGLFYLQIVFSVVKVCCGDIAANAWTATLLLGCGAYDVSHFFMHVYNSKDDSGKQTWGSWFARNVGGRIPYFHATKRAHMDHHLNDETQGFGVSSNLWDYILGTAGPTAARLH